MKKLLPLLLLVCCYLSAFPAKHIHVFVALCDNLNQGIVKVPEKIGNGQDPANNLYWGCGYGVKSFFKLKTEWVSIKTWKNPAPHILERALFKHPVTGVYMLADAYDGKFIKQCTEDMLKAAAGDLVVDVQVDSTTKLSFGKASSLIAYIGHNGLMDFSIDSYPKAKDNAKRDVIILACYSKSYFKPAVQAAGANPLLWSTHLMAPEAYTLRSAIDQWMKGASAEEVRNAAAGAYNQYQKCGYEAARRLLVTGW
jgi:hypothetical protein